MNIQHPLLKNIDINNITNIDIAVDKIRKLGLLCKIYDDILIVKYPKQLQFSDKDYILKSRGIVIDFTNKKIINHSVEGCIDYNKFKAKFNWKNIVIEERLDGTLINVYFNKKWCVSTKFCVNASEARFRNNKTFRQLFDSIAGNIYDSLDKSYTYSFLLQHHDSRNVTHVNRNKIYHIESTNNVTGEKVQITVPGADTPRILKFGQYDSLNKLTVNSYEELEDVVYKMDWQKAGVMMYTQDRQYRSKLSSPNFEKVLNLIKDQTNVNYIVIDAMYNKKNLPTLLKYYPEFSKHSVDVNNKLYNYTIKLHELYIKCKIKNTFCKLEKKYKKPLCDLHNLYKSSKEKGNIKFNITYNVVCELIRSYDSAYIHSLLF
jgi:hypothetical protein|tara:strand:- start:158 stop:1282 length:1125 start_codon:yes stop_codon:yes gene_type:complete